MATQFDISLFLASGCLSNTGALAYVRGELDQQKASLVEAHLEKCAFCREAVKGLAGAEKSVDINNVLADINSRVAQRVKERREDQAVPPVVSRGTRWAWFSAAASVLIIALFSFYFLQLNRLPFNDVAEGYIPVGEDHLKAFPLPEPAISMDTWVEETDPGIDEEAGTTQPEPAAISQEVIREELAMEDDATDEIIVEAEKKASRAASTEAKPENAAVALQKDQENTAMDSSAAGTFGWTAPELNQAPAGKGTYTAAAEEVRLSMNLTDMDVKEITAASTGITDRSYDVNVDNNGAPPIFTIVDQMPAFPGGRAAMREYFSRQLSVPPDFPDSLLGEIIYVETVIDERGKTCMVKLKDGIGDKIDRQAVRAVRRMPDWTPGVQRGENVLVRITVPVEIPHTRN